MEGISTYRPKLSFLSPNKDKIFIIIDNEAIHSKSIIWIV